MNTTNKRIWCGGNGTRRDRTPRFPHLSPAPKQTNVVQVVSRRLGGFVEVEVNTFFRFRRRFPTAPVRIETFKDCPDGTFEYSFLDTGTGVDITRKIGTN